MNTVRTMSNCADHFQTDNPQNEFLILNVFSTPKFFLLSLFKIDLDEHVSIKNS